MIHQPLGGTTGQASDINIQAREIISLKKRMCQILSKHTGRSEEHIHKDIDRDFYMSAEEAKAYGIVDEVVASVKKSRKSLEEEVR